MGLGDCVYFLFRYGNPENSPGGCSRKQVQQTLSLTLTSELTYSEMGYSEYSVPEQRI